jgi:hypothetical protein
VLAAQEHAVEIRAVHGVPTLEARVLRVVRDDLALEPRDPGVVHDDVERAALGESLLSRALPVGFLAHVETQIAYAEIAALSTQPNALIGSLPSQSTLARQ